MHLLMLSSTTPLLRMGGGLIVVLNAQSASWLEILNCTCMTHDQILHVSSTKWWTCQIPTLKSSLAPHVRRWGFDSRAPCHLYLGPQWCWQEPVFSRAAGVDREANSKPSARSLVCYLRRICPRFLNSQYFRWATREDAYHARVVWGLRPQSQHPYMYTWQQ